MRKESLLLKLWNVLWPLFIYMIAQTGISILGVLLLGEQAESFAMVLLLISALICIPIYYKMYRKDQAAAGEVQRSLPIGNKDYLAIIITGAAIAVAMNNIISISPLPQWFPGYEETNEVLFSGGMVLQIITAGILGCIVEELSHRGIAYCRMRRYWGKRNAMIFSALVFGIYHLNVVQAVYAFALGLFFAWVYERYNSLWASIIAHMSANLFVIIFGTSTLVVKLLNHIVGFCLITCISILIFYYGCRFMKQSNPVIELEFVEKEPDTLKSLTEQYKEQEREE